MRWIAGILIILFFASGCASTAKRFPAGADVQVSEWQILHGSDGAKTLRGTVSNYTPYLVYDVDLITRLYEGETFKQELVTRLPSLFPDTQTHFEIMLPSELQDPHPAFEYRFQYMHEEEFDDYRRNKQFGVGPLQMYTSAGAWKYESAREETFDSRRNK